MALLAPSYIPVEAWRSVLPDYPWSDWNPYDSIGECDPMDEHALKLLTGRAALAYAIACAEWVVFRLAPFMDDQRPFLFLEAAWAFEMSDRYAAPPESTEAEWKGPVRGAVDLALMTVLNAIYSLREDAVQVDAAFVQRLAMHVLPQQEQFLRWRSPVLARLEGHFPRQSTRGPQYVPREVMDPATLIQDEVQLRLYVESYLRAIDTTRNVMLRRV